MPIQLNGATSGSTVLVPTDAVTATLTLPSSTGTLISTSSSGQVIPSGALPAGSVLQVVNNTYTGDTSTSSGSFSTSNVYATITPKFATSKILIIATSNVVWCTANQSLQARIYRGTSGNGSGSNIGAQNYYFQPSVGSSTYTATTLTMLDSPASTSALTYTVMHASANGSSVGFLSGYGPNNLGSMTLMEIAA